MSYTLSKVTIFPEITLENLFGGTPTSNDKKRVQIEFTAEDGTALKTQVVRKVNPNGGGDYYRLKAESYKITPGLTDIFDGRDQRSAIALLDEVEERIKAGDFTEKHL